MQEEGCGCGSVSEHLLSTHGTMGYIPSTEKYMRPLSNLTLFFSTVNAGNIESIDMLADRGAAGCIFQAQVCFR